MKNKNKFIKNITKLRTNKINKETNNLFMLMLWCH